MKDNTAEVFPFGSEVVRQQAAELLLAIAVTCLLWSFSLLLIARIASDIWRTDVPDTKAVKEKDRLKAAEAVSFVESSASYSDSGRLPPLGDQLAMFLAGHRRVWRRARCLTVPSALVALLGIVCVFLFMIIELRALSGKAETQDWWQYLVGCTVIFGVTAGFSSLFFFEFLAALRIQHAYVSRRAEWCAVACWVEAITRFQALRLSPPLALLDRRQDLAHSIEQAARHTRDIYQKRLAAPLSGEHKIRLDESGVAHAKEINDMAMRSLIEGKPAADNSDSSEMLVGELLQVMDGRFELTEGNAPTMPEAQQSASRWRLVVTGLVLTVAGLAYPHIPLGGADAGSFAEAILILVGVISVLFGILGARTATAVLSAVKGVAGGGGEKG